MISIRNIKEFHCIIDMLLACGASCGNISIEFEYSGKAIRGDWYSDNDSSFEAMNIESLPGKVSIQYKDEQIRVISSTSKSVTDWVSDGYTKLYKNVCCYFPFLDSISEMTITKIVCGSADMTRRFNNAGNINIYELVKFFTEMTEYSNVRVTVTDGSKPTTFVFLDDVFTRFVKYNGKHTLYINKGESFNKRYKKYFLLDVMFCCGLPYVTSQINMFQNMSDSSETEFKYVIS